MATSQPQLDPETLRNLAINLNAPPPAPVAAPVQMAAQPDLGISLPSKSPVVFGPHGQTAGAPMAQRGTLEGDKQERARELGAGAGVDQIYGRITQSPFGQQHPLVGKILGGLAQGVAKAGDIGLSAVAPALAINLPGTEYHHQLEQNQLNHQIANDENQGKEEAQTAETQARVPLEEAQTAALQQPIPKDAQDTFVKVYQQEHPGSGIEDATQAFTDATTRDKQQTPEQSTYDALIKTGAKPLDALAQVYGAKGEKSIPLSQQYLDALNKGDTAKAGLIQKAIKDTETQPKIDVHTAESTKTANTATEKEFGYYRAKWDKELGTFSTQNEKLSEASSMVGSGAMGAALGSVKALSGLAAGQGSGVRITQAELNSIARARGLGGDFEAALQKFGDGNKLTPQQVTALKSIISDVQHIAAAKEAVINQGLDDLSTATDTKTIRKIDSQLRHVLMGGA